MAQKLFDDYMLRFFNKKEVIKKNKKIIEEQEFYYDPTMNEDRMKGSFNCFFIVDRTNLHTT